MVAINPIGSPSVVMAKLECIKTPADYGVLWGAGTLVSDRILAENANSSFVLAAKAELSRVMKYQERRLAAPDAIACGLEMSLQNLRLAPCEWGRKR